MGNVGRGRVGEDPATVCLNNRGHNARGRGFTCRTRDDDDSTGEAIEHLRQKVGRDFIDDYAGDGCSRQACASEQSRGRIAR